MRGMGPSMRWRTLVTATAVIGLSLALVGLGTTNGL